MVLEKFQCTFFFARKFTAVGLASLFQGPNCDLEFENLISLKGKQEVKRPDLLRYRVGWLALKVRENVELRVVKTLHLSKSLKDSLTPRLLFSLLWPPATLTKLSTSQDFFQEMYRVIMQVCNTERNIEMCLEKAQLYVQLHIPV